MVSGHNSKATHKGGISGTELQMRQDMSGVRPSMHEVRMQQVRDVKA